MPRVHFPDPPAHARTDPLSPLRGWLPAVPGGSEAEPEPEAGRQDAEVPGSTPHPCPSFSGHPEGAATFSPSFLGKGRRESVERAGRCWAGRCCHEACLPSHAGAKEPGCHLLGPCRRPNRLPQRPLFLPSFLGNGTEDRAEIRAGPAPRAQGPRQLLQSEPRQRAGSVCPSIPQRGAEMTSSRKRKKAFLFEPPLA